MNKYTAEDYQEALNELYGEALESDAIVASENKEKLQQLVHLHTPKKLVNIDYYEELAHCPNCNTLLPLSYLACPNCRQHLEALDRSDSE